MRAKLTDETSIKAVLQDMTLEEKAGMLIAAGPCLSQAIPDMGIPSIVLADGATGVNGTHIILDFFMEMMKHAMEKRDAGSASKRTGMGNPWIETQQMIAAGSAKAAEMAAGNPMKEGFLRFLKGRQNPAGAFIAFPSGINIGAGFNEEQAYAAGRAVGLEMRSSHLDVCLGPNVDIIRDPLGGRNYEMYGEDPVLVSRTGTAFIRGMQSTGTAACAKHYLCNNQETRRQTKDTHVSKRTMRELYAKGFEAAVKDAGVKAVMSAYNAVNGVFSSYNRETLTGWLKEEWGLDGIVVSDWGAVTGDNDKAVEAGMDLVLHGPSPCDSSDIVKAVQNGTLPEKRVDEGVERILKLILWLRDTQAANPVSYDQEALLKTAYDTVVDGIVLLKNAANALPLAKTEKVAFFGNRARETMACGSGSTFVTTPLRTNVYEEAEKLGVTVLDAEMEAADTVVFAAGAEGGENADRPSMELDRADQDAIADVLHRAKQAGKKTVVILNVAAPVDVRGWIADADAVLVLFVPGCMGGKAAASVLFGDAEPAGRLPVTFPVKLSDSPASPYPTGEYEDIYYSEGVFVGYRWYDAKEIPSAYPFGYGLSYTDFEISVAEPAARWDIREDDAFTVKARVKNIGSRPGAEVLQLYLARDGKRVPMPVKELKAYAKVFLQPGEEKEIRLVMKRSDLEICDPEKGLLTPVGQARVMVGLDSEQEIASFALAIDGKNPYVMNETTSLGEILANPAALKIVENYVPGLTGSLGDHIRLMSNEPIGPFLSKRLIGSIPDANELKSLLDKLYAELAQL